MKNQIKVVNFLLGSPLRMVITVILCLGITIFTINNTVMRYACVNNWAESGINSKYTWTGTCLVEVESGHWIPAENYKKF